MLCAVLVSGQETAAPRQLYLLSATPTEHTNKTYPVVLYRLSADKRLKVVREVVPQADGVRFVQAWGDAIFVIHPHVISTAVTIVHTGEPMLADDVVFNPRGLILADAWVAVAAPSASSVDELVPLITDASQPTHIKGTVASISSNPTGTASRVRSDAWDEYAALRREGEPGGPTNIVPYLVGSTAGDNVAVSVFGHSIVIDTLPPSLRGATAKITPFIVAVNPEYNLLVVQPPAEDWSSGKLPNSTEMFVHDRARGRWKTIRIEGNTSARRLFGPWLATIVGMWNPDHKPSPGRDNERNQETDRLPNVQNQYAIFVGKWSWRPGVLVLQNLADGRKIRIETGQEDSEILRVEGDIVLYRINDTIYQAKIVGDQLRDPTVVVKDEDVPEIHWVFWSQ